MERPRSLDGERRGRRSLRQQPAPASTQAQRDAEMARLLNETLRAGQKNSAAGRQDVPGERTEQAPDDRVAE